MRLRVSNWGMAAFWVVIAFIHPCGILYCASVMKPGEEWALVFLSIMSGVIFLVSLVFFWATGKYYILTDAGIEHRFVGVCYRTTAWDEIADISFCELPIVFTRRFHGLIFTRKGCRIYRSKIYIPKRTKEYVRSFLPDWLRGKLFIIRTHDIKNADKIIPFVLDHYGDLDNNDFG